MKPAAPASLASYADCLVLIGASKTRMRRAWGGGRELRLPQLAGESTTGSRWTNNWFVVRMVTKVRPRCSALAPLAFLTNVTTIGNTGCL